MSNTSIIVMMFSDPPPQMDRENGLDYFRELPVSLVLFALILVDVIERLRPFRLCGQRESHWVLSPTGFFFKTRCSNVS